MSEKEGWRMGEKEREREDIYMLCERVCLCMCAHIIACACVSVSVGGCVCEGG